MQVIISNITLVHLLYICTGLLFLVVILVGCCFRLSRKIKKLSQNVFSLSRNFDHKETVLEQTVSQIASGLPIDLHPDIIEDRILKNVEDILHRFSIKLNKRFQESLLQEQNIWNDKFSILLKVLNKNEKDLNGARDHLFKDSWTSISKLRQKSQLLFNDMKEDGIFFRMQSLWQISHLDFLQQSYQDSFRHSVAAIKLYYDSKPSLPLSHKLLWKIGAIVVQNGSHLDPALQKEILQKFYLSPSDIIQSFQDETEHFQNNIETMHSLRLWAQQLSF